MKKKIKKYFIIREHTFKIRLNVLLGYSFDELNRFLEKRGFAKLEENEKVNNGIAFTCYKGNDGVPYYTIWIEDFYWSLPKQALMVHELSHIVFEFLKFRCIEEKGSEVYAYLLEYFFLELSLKINKIIN